MSLSRKAKTQLFKWMQERHKDLHVVSDRLFWGVPLSHVLCGIVIDGSSRKDRFSVLAQVTPLYQSATMFTLGWSSNVSGPAPKHGGYWFGTDPDLHNAFEDIYLNTIRPEIDPYHNLSNLEVYQQHRIETHQEGGVPQATLALTQLALGKFDQARATWQRVVDTTPAGILKACLCA